jgi:hypothetical protein
VYEPYTQQQAADHLGVLMTSIFIIPGFSGKKPGIKQTFQRSFPQALGKFCTPFCS